VPVEAAGLAHLPQVLQRGITIGTAPAEKPTDFYRFWCSLGNLALSTKPYLLTRGFLPVSRRFAKWWFANRWARPG